MEQKIFLTFWTCQINNKTRSSPSTHFYGNGRTGKYRFWEIPTPNLTYIYGKSILRPFVVCRRPDISHNKTDDGRIVIFLIQTPRWSTPCTNNVRLISLNRTDARKPVLIDNSFVIDTGNRILYNDKTRCRHVPASRLCILFPIENGISLFCIWTPTE